MENVAPILSLYGLALGLIAAAFPGLALAGTLFFLSFLISLVLAIDSFILYLMTADPASCGKDRDKLFAVPLFLAALGAIESIPASVGVALFAAANVVDGAINNSCPKI